MFYNYPFQQQNQLQIPPMQSYAPKTMQMIYASEEEVKAYILAPSNQLYAIDKEQAILYIKTADSFGRSNVEKFRIVPFGEQRKEPVEILTKKDLEAFATKEQVAELRNKLINLEKGVKIEQKAE